MKLFFTTSQVPAAPAAERFPSITLPACRPLVSVPGSARPALQQLHKDRKRASLAAHRAQVLGQRRTSIPSSAKRW